MGSRTGRFITGGALIVVGLMILPSYNQILTALTDIIDTMFPSLPDTTALVINSLPLLVLVMIFVGGGMMIISSLMAGGTRE